MSAWRLRYRHQVAGNGTSFELTTAERLGAVVSALQHTYPFSLRTQRRGTARTDPSRRSRYGGVDLSLAEGGTWRRTTSSRRV